MATVVQLTLLGGFGLRRTNRGDVRLPTRKAEALLAYLACHPGEKQPRDRLTALLWGDRGDKQARHSLSQTLLSLRQELGEANSLLLIERESVALRADAVETDVLEFRRLATTPGGSRASLDLYRGPFLDGFSLREPGFEDWLIEQRAQLQGIAFGTFLALADAQTRGRRLERRHVDAEQRHPVRSAGGRGLSPPHDAADRARAVQRCDPELSHPGRRLAAGVEDPAGSIDHRDLSARDRTPAAECAAAGAVRPRRRDRHCCRRARRARPARGDRAAPCVDRDHAVRRSRSGTRGQDSPRPRA